MNPSEIPPPQSRFISLLNALLREDFSSLFALEANSRCPESLMLKKWYRRQLTGTPLLSFHVSVLLIASCSIPLAAMSLGSSYGFSVLKHNLPFANEERWVMSRVWGSLRTVEN